MPQITEANRKKNNKRNQASIDQTPKELIPNKQLKNAFKNPTAHPPQPKKRLDGLKVDSKQSHHSGVPLDSFTSFTEGMSEKQVKATRKALEKQGLLTGDHLLNSIDLWKRYHQGKSSGPYKGQGAHQRTNELQIDGTKAKKRWESLSPDERFGQLERFVADMGTNRRIAQESDFASRQLLRGDNTPDNEYGGNFSQRILSPRNAENAAVNAENAKGQRKLYKPSVQREPSPVHGSTRSATKKLTKKALALVPIAGGIDALSRSAAAAQKGDYATAAVNVGEAIVGELPGGDAVIESVTGRGLGDGTVTGQQRLRAERPTDYGAAGPNLTTPQQSNRAALLRKDPSQERGYETIQRVGGQVMNAIGGWMKTLGIN